MLLTAEASARCCAHHSELLRRRHACPDTPAVVFCCPPAQGRIRPPPQAQLLYSTVASIEAQVGTVLTTQ